MSEWIAVKDQLPDENVHVLIYYNERTFVGYMDSWTYRKKKNIRWNEVIADNDYNSYYPDHLWWQPLPEAPKG